MNDCFGCGFYDEDTESCTCYCTDKSYACPLESAEVPEDEKEENETR